jgi:hypothetical protein
MKTILNSHCLNQVTDIENPYAHFKQTGTNIRKFIISCYRVIVNLLFWHDTLGHHFNMLSFSETNSSS